MQVQKYTLVLVVTQILSNRRSSRQSKVTRLQNVTFKNRKSYCMFSKRRQNLHACTLACTFFCATKLRFIKEKNFAFSGARNDDVSLITAEIPRSKARRFDIANAHLRRRSLIAADFRLLSCIRLRADAIELTSLHACDQVRSRIHEMRVTLQSTRVISECGNCARKSFHYVSISADNDRIDINTNGIDISRTCAVLPIVDC